MTSASLAADRLTSGVTELGRRIEAASAQVGTTVRWDWTEVLHRRAERRDQRPGRTTASGAGRLLRGADGWVAVQLTRPDDVDLLPAWLALAEPARAPGPVVDPSNPWPAVAAAVSRFPAHSAVHAAALVGLAVSHLRERSPTADGGARVSHRGARRRTTRRAKVVDLSALWAGPLCGAVLAEAGAEVVKVESASRPDGARAGDPGLFTTLNRAKTQRRLDLTTPAGRGDLSALIRGADVVIESSRPRALEQLGIVAASEVASGAGPSIWVSITGHGRSSPRIAFGDDAAVAGGLVIDAPDGPQFRGDALADPLSGLAAAATALELWAAGEGGLIEVTMAAVAAAHAEPGPEPLR